MWVNIDIFFDLNSVILDFEKCEIDALRRTFDNASIYFNEDRLFNNQ